MNDFVLKDEETGNKKHFDSRSEAEEMAQELMLDDYTIQKANGSEPEPGSAEDMDARTSDDVEVIDMDETEEKMKEGYEKRAEASKESTMGEDGKPIKTSATHPEEFDMPGSKPELGQDPVDWMPGHFVDEIQGVPTVNRKGYAVLASQYGVSVTAEPVTLASETDFEYAEFRAVATTANGEEYTGFGSAHIDRMDGDDEYLLNELAETRAMKRATSWATGIGMTAIEEMKGEL